MVTVELESRRLVTWGPMMMMFIAIRAKGQDPERETVLFHIDIALPHRRTPTALAALP